MPLLVGVVKNLPHEELQLLFESLKLSASIQPSKTIQNWQLRSSAVPAHEITCSKKSVMQEFPDIVMASNLSKSAWFLVHYFMPISWTSNINRSSTT